MLQLKVDEKHKWVECEEESDVKRNVRCSLKEEKPWLLDKSWNQL